jgi:hypothetical protein
MPRVKPREGMKQVTFYLPDELVERVDAAARAEDRTRPAEIAHLIKMGLLHIESPAMVVWDGDAPPLAHPPFQP